MNLHLLCSAHQVEIYSDTLNNWLFIDWVGDLTLDTVQHACLEIAHCYQHHAYPRVLNSNAQVTSVTPDVAKWLASEFMPVLNLIGVERLAWVVAPNLQGRTGALDTVMRLPTMHFDLFDDVESAVAWLQQTAPLPPNESAPLPDPATQEAERTHLVNHLLAQHAPEPLALT